MMEEISCTQCHRPIPAEYYNTPDIVGCPSCQAPIRIDVFPAFLRALGPGKPGEALIDDQASCFYHPQKRASIPCDHCGRFLCALCDVEWGGKHLCPTCLETGKRKGKIVNLDRHRVLYDSTALRLAILPMIMFWVTLVTAPLTLYLSVRHWNSPMGIVRRTKVRFIIAMIISIFQILAWVLGFALLKTFWAHLSFLQRGGA
jgi:hypothetical protein